MAKTTFISFIGVILFLEALCVVGTMDYNDEVQEQVTYCSMVKAGIWGAYRGTKICNTEKAGGTNDQAGIESQDEKNG